MKKQNGSKTERINNGRDFFPEPDCLTVILLSILSYATIWAFFRWTGLLVYLGFSVTVLFILMRLK